MKVIPCRGYQSEHNFAWCNKRTVVKNVLLIPNVIQSHCVEKQCEAYIVLTWYQYQWAKTDEEKAKSKSSNKKNLHTWKSFEDYHCCYCLLQKVLGISNNLFLAFIH